MIEQLKKYFVRLVIHLPTAQSYALRWRTDGILSRSRLSSHTNLSGMVWGFPSVKLNFGVNILLPCNNLGQKFQLFRRFSRRCFGRRRFHFFLTQGH
jgi:hypothetical protein